MTIGKKRAGWHRGRRAEIFALCWLVLKGYWPVARNLRLPMGEIDLIMRRGRVLVFIEVKYRTMPVPIGASVSAHQWRRIAAAAGAFVARRPRFQQFYWRFDQILLTRHHWPQHRQNVWRI